LSDHAKPVNDRVDLGHRLFLAGFFLPLALAASTATIGFGLTGHVLIPLVGLANVLALLFAANILHQGNKTAEKVVKFAGLVLLIAGLAVLFTSQNLATCFLGEQLLMFVIFAAAVATPSAGAFFAYQRHEFVELPAEVEAPAVEIQVESVLAGGALREEAKAAAKNYSLVLRAAGTLLVLVAFGGIALAIYSLMNGGAGVKLIFASLFALPAAPVLLTLGDRWSFLATTTGHEKAHLSGIAADSQTLVNCASVSAVLLALLAILELATW
jgi:hypothetical protein